MEQKTITKYLKAYSKYYRNALTYAEENHIDQRMETFEKRLTKMYQSDQFEAHNVYPSTNVSFVYAVIAMVLRNRPFPQAKGQSLPITDCTA